MAMELERREVMAMEWKDVSPWCMITDGRRLIRQKDCSCGLSLDW